MSKDSKKQDFIPIEDVVSRDSGGYLLNRVDPEQLARSYLHGLPDKKIIAFLLYKVGLFGELFSQRRIAALLNISQPMVLRMIREVEKKIADSVSNDMGRMF